MKHASDWLKEPLVHLIVVVVALVFLFGPSHPARTTMRGAGHHNGHCRACAAGLPPECLRQRDLFLAKTGCIDLPDE